MRRANTQEETLYGEGFIYLLTIVLLTVGRFHLYRMMHLKRKTHEYYY